jgi:hypothetical protein
MKLLTHNMLACHIKGVKNNYPFKIEAKKVEEREAEFNPGTVHLSGCPEPPPPNETTLRIHYRDRLQKHHCIFIYLTPLLPSATHPSGPLEKYLSTHAPPYLPAYCDGAVAASDMRWTLRFMAFAINDAPLSCCICLMCAEFLRHIFPRLEWTALKEAAETVCQPAK